MLMDNFLSASVCSSSADRVNKGVVTAFSPGGLAHADSVLAAPRLCVACMPIFNPLSISSLFVLGRNSVSQLLVITVGLSHALCLHEHLLGFFS